MVTELTTLMKNGYKAIEAIAQLPAKEQRTLQHMIETCKITK